MAGDIAHFVLLKDIQVRKLLYERSPWLVQTDTQNHILAYFVPSLKGLPMLGVS